MHKMTMKISLSLNDFDQINMKSEFGSRWHKDLGMAVECATENGNIKLLLLLFLSENSLKKKKTNCAK